MTAPVRGIQLNLWASLEVDAGVPTRHDSLCDANITREGRVPDKSAAVRRTGVDHSTNGGRTAGVADPRSPEPGADPQLVSDATGNPKRPVIEVMVLPDWLPRDAWAAYVRMRNKIGAPLSDHSMARAVRSLIKLRDAGHDPAAVLNQSVVRRVRGLSAVMSLSLPVVGAFVTLGPS